MVFRYRIIFNLEIIMEFSRGGGTDGIFYKYRDSNGNLYVRYLYWNGGRWVSNYNWLSNDWNGNNPALSLANISFPPPKIFWWRFCI